MQDERIKLRTEVDTDEASTALEALKAEYRDIKREIKEMGQVSEEWSDEQKQAYAELRQRQRELNAEINEYTRNIDLNDASMNELNARLRQLVQEQKQLTAGSEEWIEKTKEVNQVKDRISDVREEANRLGRAIEEQETMFDRWKDAFAGQFAALQLDNLVDSVVEFGVESVESAARTSDAFAEIEKTTGMTNEEVQKLNKELAEIDTRTFQDVLQEIAAVGGQLGISKNEMRGFVEMTDRAVVAMGDEFSGGAEEVASKMGTLSQLFKETKELEAGEAINQIGSALNELGAAGSATAPVVAEFTTRIGQLGNLAPQISETMGLGAALQELGLSAEIAAGGLTAIMMTGAKEIEAFASQMGMAKGEVQALIDSNPNEFLLKLAESFRGLSNTQVQQRLAEMKVGSQEAVKVMSLLATQTDVVRDKQKLAAQAMMEGTSLTKEFNKVNQTQAAQLDKAKKAVEQFKTEFGQGLIPIVLKGAEGLGFFINILRGAPQFFRENQTAIGLLAIGVLTLNANLIRAQVSSLAKAAATRAEALASALATAAEAARAQATARATAADNAATTASQRLTIQERLAAVQTTASNVLTQAKIVLTNAWTVSQNALNNALRANPIGIVITVLAALAAGLVIAYQRSETFRGIVNGVWAALKVGWQALKDLWGVLSGFLSDALEPVMAKLEPAKQLFMSLFNLLRSGVGFWIDMHKAVYDFVASLVAVVAKSAPVQAAIQGIWSIIQRGIQTVKDAANAVAEFLHIDGLVSRAKATGQQMGQAFKETYNKEIAAARAKDQTDHDAHHAKQTASANQAAKQQAGDKQLANAGALSSMSADEEKHRQSEQKKAADHARKVAEEKRKANQAANDDIRQRGIELIQDEQQRKLAQLAFERDQEKARIQESVADQKLKAQQLDLIEKQYQADVAATQKEFRDRKAQAEKEAMDKYLADKQAQAEKERSLFNDLQQYVQATEQTNAALSVNLERMTEDQKLNYKRSQLQQGLSSTQASIMQEYQAKLNEIQTNISDNDARAKAIKTLNDWKNSQLAAADKQHATDMQTLNKEHLEQRRQNTKQFFDAVDGLMKGDYTGFMNILEKKLSNEKAANQKGLQNFAQKGTETLEVAAQVVGALQTLNQKYLESKVNKINKEKDAQLKSWDAQYKAGKISKEQYEKGIDKINKDAAEKEKAEKLKAWKRDQAMQIAMALINAAMAALKSLATMGFPLGLIGVAASAAMAAIQIGIIKSQKPPSFRKGGFVNGGVPDGPSHGSSYGKSGLAIVERDGAGGYGEEKGEMEGGEPIMILSRNTYKNNKPVIDQLLHSSLHKNGAPIYRAGGLMGNDGGSYRDYLEPLRKGQMYLFGSKKKKREAEEAAAAAQADANAAMSDAGGDMGGIDGNADENTAVANEQIERSQKVMEDIADNTKKTASLVDDLLRGFSSLGNLLANNAADVRYKLDEIALSFESSQARQGDRMLNELRTQLSQSRSGLAAILNLFQLALVAELRRLNVNSANEAESTVKELQIQGKLLREDQARLHMLLVRELQNQGKLGRTLDENQHQDLTDLLSLLSMGFAMSASNRHTSLTKQLDQLFKTMNDADQRQYNDLIKELQNQGKLGRMLDEQQFKAMVELLKEMYKNMSDADQRRYIDFMKQLELQLNDLTNITERSLSDLNGEMKRQASALISETKSQTTAIVNSDTMNTGKIRGDMSTQSYYLNQIAGKQWSVSVNNVVQVFNEVNVINKDSDLR